MDTEPYLRLRLANRIILIRLGQIHSVLPIMELQTVPNQDHTLAGLLNFHGQAAPVYHLAELLELPQIQYDLNNPIILCMVAGQLVGLIATEVIDIHPLQQAIQKGNLGSVQPYVTGVVEQEEWSAWVLDLEQLFDNRLS